MYVVDGDGFHKRRYFRAERPCGVEWRLIYSNRKGDAGNRVMRPQIDVIPASII